MKPYLNTDTPVYDELVQQHPHVIEAMNRPGWNTADAIQRSNANLVKRKRAQQTPKKKVSS